MSTVDLVFRNERVQLGLMYIFAMGFLALSLPVLFD